MIDIVQDCFISFEQEFHVHLRYDIGRAVNIVTGSQAPQSTFFFHPFVQFSARWRLKQTYHGGDDAALLNKIYLSLKNRGAVGVETDNKAALNLQSRALNAFDAFDQVAIFILLFIAFRQAFLVRGLNADKYGVEPGFDHQMHQILVISKVDGCLGIEQEPLFAFLPVNQSRQQLVHQVFFVADKVVIDKKYMTAPAPTV